MLESRTLPRCHSSGIWSGLLVRSRLTLANVFVAGPGISADQCVQIVLRTVTAVAFRRVVARYGWGESDEGYRIPPSACLYSNANANHREEQILAYPSDGLWIREMNERFTEPEFSPRAIYRLVGVTLVIEIANRRENLSGVVPRIFLRRFWIVTSRTMKQIRYTIHKFELRSYVG